MPENTNKVIQLKDAEGNDVSPVVNVGSIYDKNGQKVDNLLSYTVAGTDVPVPELPDAISDSIASTNLPIRDIRELQIANRGHITAGSAVDVNENNQVFSNVNKVDPVTSIIAEQIYMDSSASIKISDNYMLIVFRAGNSVAYRIVSLTSGITINETTFETELYSRFKIHKLTDSNLVLIGYRGATGFAFWPIQISGVSSVNVYNKFMLGNISSSYYSSAVLSSNRIILMNRYQNNNTLDFYLLNCTGTTVTKLSEQSSSATFNGSYQCYVAKAPSENDANKFAVIACDPSLIKAFYGTISGTSIVLNENEMTTKTINTNNLITNVNNIDSYGSIVFMLSFMNHSLYGCGIEIKETSIDIGEFSPIFEIDETWTGITQTARFIGNRMVIIASLNVNSPDTSKYNVVSAIVDDISSTGFTLSGTSELLKNTYANIDITPISDSSFFFAGLDNVISRPVSATMQIFMDEIAGSFTFNSTDGIALESGDPGDIIRVGFSGNCECDGIKPGYSLSTSGVCAYAIRDGWISIVRRYDNTSPSFVCGEYLGTGEAKNVIDVGFSPAMIMIFEAYNVSGRPPASITLFQSQTSYISPFTSASTNISVGVSWSTTGVTLTLGSGADHCANRNNSRYCYIAFKRW